MQEYITSLTFTVWQVGMTPGRIVSRLVIPAHWDIFGFSANAGKRGTGKREWNSIALLY